MVNLVIVHDKNNAEVAQQLHALISAMENCQSRVMDEDHWKDNRSIVSSEQYVLYMGNVPDGNAIQPIIKWKYEYKNMKYGWIGKKGVFCVEKRNYTKEDVAEIKSMLEEQQRLLTTKSKNLPASIAMYAVVQVAFGLIGVGITAATSTLVNNIKETKDFLIAEREYLLTRLIAEEDFYDFLGLKGDEQDAY